MSRTVSRYRRSERSWKIGEERENKRGKKEYGQKRKKTGQEKSAIGRGWGLKERLQVNIYTPAQDQVGGEEGIYMTLLQGGGVEGKKQEKK